MLQTLTKRRMFKRIIEITLDKSDEEGKEETTQSYLGLLSHGNAYKLRRKIIELGESLPEQSKKENKTIDKQQNIPTFSRMSEC